MLSENMFCQNNKNYERNSKIIDEALEEMPDSFVIKDLLMKNKAEVKDMLLDMLDEEKTPEEYEAEIRNVGIKLGLHSYKERLLTKLINDGYSKEEAERIIEI